jgi:signal transduction histidine kinase
MPLSNQKIRSGFSIAFLLLLISYFLIFFTIQKLLEQTKIVAHTYTVINHLEELKSSVVDAETGVRGYVISKDIRFLKPYNNSLKTIPVIYKELRQLTNDNKNQSGRMDTLDTLIKKRLSYIENGIRLFQISGFQLTNSMNVAREASKNAMDSIRLYIASMKETEEKLMVQRRQEVSSFFTGTTFIMISSLIITFITIFYSIILYNRESKAKKSADKNAEQYRAELETNVKKLKQTNSQLQELKSIEKFAATGRVARTIAHEVRNPLTNISLATEQLQEMILQNADSAVLLDMVSRNANRINQLVSDLLDATRFGQLTFRETNINQVLDETLEMAKDRIGLNHIKVEKKYSKDLCNVSVDVEKIRFALLNIIVNAIEAMEKDKGVLHISTKKERDKCLIEIKDNGKGMDEEVLQKIFEPYFTGKHDGNGLGLTNTQNIILNHGGKITVTSIQGEGSSFIVELTMVKIPQV